MEPTIRKFTRGAVTKWEVDFGKDASGVRRRPYFSSKAEARAEVEKYRKDVKAQGHYLAKLPDVERTTLVAVYREIKAAGLTVSHVWERYQSHKKEVAAQATTIPMPYEEVVTEFKRRKLENGKTKRYVHNTGEFLMRFGVGRERQNIHEIPAGDLEAWLDGQTKSQGWSMSTKRTYKLLFSSLWSVATAKNWATVNIVDRLEPVTVVPQKIKIYMTEETQNIMAAALSTPDTKRVLAPLALGAFGCMRPEEIDSSKAKSEGLPETTYFGWHDIDLKNGLIKVRPEIAKTGDERTIRLQPAAVAWLKLARSLGNPLPPVNERRLVDLCCEIINLQEWIRDGLRKSCATHLRAVYKNDYDVVKDLGNSVRILLKHYAALHIPDEQSLDHWKITPEAVGKYMKTRAWELVLRDAAKASITTPRPSASGNAKSSN